MGTWMGRIIRGLGLIKTYLSFCGAYLAAHVLLKPFGVCVCEALEAELAGPEERNEY